MDNENRVGMPIKEHYDTIWHEPKTPDIKPLTIVDEDAEVAISELVRRIEATREKHGDILQKYHEVWYNAPHTWHFTHFLGVGLMKCPNDLWIYQAIMSDIRPTVVIETGTYQGGSALWFAFLQEMLGIDGHVYTIDFEDRRQCAHPRITFLGGDSRNPAIRDAIVEDINSHREPAIEYHSCGCRLNMATVFPTVVHLCEHHTEAEALKRNSIALPDERQKKQRMLISLDADHSADHVRQELELYAPLCKLGDRLVVEDTNIGWEGENGDRGARGGLTDYLNAHPGEWQQDVISERYLLTMNPGGWLIRVGEYRA